MKFSYIRMSMSNKTPRVAVLIPCYNEEVAIGKVVADFKKVLPEASIYVYDNNSTDATAAIAAEAGAIVRHEYRQGKGNVIRSMFRQIEADCYIMVDGDDTYPAEAAPILRDMVLQQGADMAIGDRLSSTYFVENKRPFHNVGNRMVRFLINWLFKSEVKDIMTGYRAFSRLFVKNFPVLSKQFELETEMTIYALSRNFAMKEIPIDYRDRPEGGVSKLNTFRDGFKVLMTIFRLFRDNKPMVFFSCVSLILFAVAVGLFIPVFMEYLSTSLVPRTPTLIVSSAMLTCSLLSFACGLILECLEKKHAQVLEILMNATFVQK